MDGSSVKGEALRELPHVLCHCRYLHRHHDEICSPPLSKSIITSLRCQSGELFHHHWNFTALAQSEFSENVAYRGILYTCSGVPITRCDKPIPFAGAVHCFVKTCRTRPSHHYRMGGLECRSTVRLTGWLLKHVIAVIGDIGFQESRAE